MQIYIHIYICSKSFFIFFSAFPARRGTFRKKLSDTIDFEALIFRRYLNLANKTTLASSPRIAPISSIGHLLLRFFGSTTMVRSTIVVSRKISLSTTVSLRKRMTIPLPEFATLRTLVLALSRKVKRRIIPALSQRSGRVNSVKLPAVTTCRSVWTMALVRITSAGFRQQPVSSKLNMSVLLCSIERGTGFGYLGKVTMAEDLGGWVLRSPLMQRL
jgi:hypothetical protein